MNAEKQKNKTHRCIECPVQVEHYYDELCQTTGRCRAHGGFDFPIELETDKGTFNFKEFADLRAKGEI